ncbi:hypothetical protein MCETHM1_02298 [Flavobacteriaceae bacterium]
MKNKNQLSIVLIFGGSLIVSLIAYVLKFRTLSFINSIPEDWNILTSYLSNIINPILALINLVIFIKLTKSVQRASENKAWVERTENLTFSLIDIVSKQAAFLVITTENILKINLEEQPAYLIQNNVTQVISTYNNLITEEQYKLRLYVESNIFNNCINRDSFLESINHIIPEINNVLDIYKAPAADNTEILRIAFTKIEDHIKNVIQNGKKFCDEIYNL